MSCVQISRWKAYQPQQNCRPRTLKLEVFLYLKTRSQCIFSFSIPLNDKKDKNTFKWQKRTKIPSNGKKDKDTFKWQKRTKISLSGKKDKSLTFGAFSFVSVGMGFQTNYLEARNSQKECSFTPLKIVYCLKFRINIFHVTWCRTQRRSCF